MKNTSRLSITEAIALSGISRSQFYSKYIKQGRISKSKDEQGRIYIDKSELYRVFPDIKTIEDNTDHYSKINMLKQNCMLLEQENTYLKDRISHYELLEQRSFERESSLHSTIKYYQQGLIKPKKEQKKEQKKNKTKQKKTKKNKKK